MCYNVIDCLLPVTDMPHEYISRNLNNRGRAPLLEKKGMITVAAKTVRRYKYKNIAIAMAIVLLLILSLFTACFGEKPKEKNTNDSSSVSEKDNSSEVDKNKLTDNFRYISIKNEDAIGKGVLTLIDSKNKYTGGTPANLTGVYDYLFNKSGEQIMSASSTEVKGEKALMEALNSMMSDFYNKTKLTNVIVNTVYYNSNSDDSKKAEENTADADSKEHETGYAFDLNTYTADTGSYPEFTGEGKYKWILENCHKYGIIQRYTEEKSAVTGTKAQTDHFRYVGKPNAEIMTKNNLCLEEYIDFIKDYTFEKPLTFESDEMITYAVYYIAADKGKTTNLPIPLKENDTEYPYQYSGNNKDGYIMWIITEDNSDLLKTDAHSTLDSSKSISESDSSKTSIKDDSSNNVDSKTTSAKDSSSKPESSSKTDSSKSDSSKSERQNGSR